LITAGISAWPEPRVDVQENVITVRVPEKSKSATGAAANQKLMNWKRSSMVTAPSLLVSVRQTAGNCLNQKRLLASPSSMVRKRLRLPLIASAMSATARPSMLALEGSV
jgi:hypothetical protein